MSTINPTISIIVPVYNVEKYLPRCIDSILNQTFSDFELILVDDGSPDRCGHICDEYAAKDERICVIHKRNGGVSSARNAALDIVQGEYVMFCDSDDYVEPDWLQVMYEAIITYPNAWISCNIWSVDANGLCSSKISAAPTDLYTQISFFDLYTSTLSGSLWNKIFNTTILRTHNIRFNEAYRIGEDTAFNMQYYRYCIFPLLISKPLYFYCFNGSSAINSYKFNSFDLYRHTFFDRLPYIEPEHLDEYLDEWLWKFLNMLENVFDARNPMSFFQKMRYNQAMMNTPEFIYCAQFAPGKHDGASFMKVVRMHNYYLYWIFRKIINLKSRICD